MTTDELKTQVDEYRGRLKLTAGSVCMCSASGPVGMGVIDLIVQTLDALDRRIAHLEDTKSPSDE